MPDAALSRVECNAIRRIGIEPAAPLRDAAARLRAVCAQQQVPVSLCHALSRDFARQAPNGAFCAQYTDSERRRALACLSAASEGGDWAASAQRVDEGRGRLPRSALDPWARHAAVGALCLLSAATSSMALWCWARASRAWRSPNPHRFDHDAPQFGLVGALLGACCLVAIRALEPLRRSLWPSDEAVRQAADFSFLRTLERRNRQHHGPGPLLGPGSPPWFDAAQWMALS